MQRPSRLLVLVLVLVAIGPAVTAAPSKKALAEAEIHFKAGTSHYNAAHWEAAISEFEAAYAAAPIPGFLYNLGQAYRMRGDKRRAVDSYRRYLDGDPNGPVAGEARSHIVDLTRQLDEEQARAAAAPASPGDARPTPTPTATGTATPTTAAATASPEAASAAPGTATKPVEIVPQSPTAAGGATATTPSPTSPPATAAPTPVYKKWWLWTIIGGAVVVTAVVGIGIGVASQSEQPSDGTFTPFSLRPRW